MLRAIGLFLQASRRPTAGVGAIALTLCLFAACKQEPPPPSAPNSAPTTTAPPAPRIISTVPAATAQLIQIGAVDQLVGVTRYDLPILPPGKEGLPIVGDYDTLNYELLLKLLPTALVVQMTPSHITPRLREIVADQHIDLVNIKLDTLADLYRTAQALGRISGRAKQAADAVTAMQTALANIQRQWAHGPHPRVAYLLSASPIMVVGGGTFMDEMLKIAGSQNVCATQGGDYPTINRETLIKLAPDVLLIAAAGEPPSTGLQDPRLAPWIDLPIPAARQSRIYLVTEPNGELATLTIADQLRTLARTIHQGDFVSNFSSTKAAP